MPPSENQLPDLDPTLLMSAAGQREFEAAQAARGDLHPTSLAGSGRFSVAELAAAEQQLPDLTSIFLDEVARELDSAQDSQAVEFGVDFAGGEEEMVIQASPNERARFQVGRESPPEFPIRRETYSGPSDGEIVSRRAGGRFQPVLRTNEVRRQVPLGRPTEGSRSLMASRVTQVARTPEPPQKLAPTALDRLLGPDPFK